MRRTFASIVIITAAGCGGPTVDRQDGGPLFEVDAGVVVPDPPRWTLQNIDATTPYGIATLRGRSDAKHVIISGVSNPIHNRVLPDGSFCADVRLEGPGTYVFEAIGLEGGEKSGPSDELTIVFDPSSPDLPRATTCSGDHPAACIGAVEICGNNRDDDCNSLIDEDDPTCAICTDDPLEPNDEPSAPQIDPGRIPGLVLCPGDVDYYGIYAEGGETIVAQAFFSHAEGNIDLVLYGINKTKAVAQSITGTDDELLTHTATTSGVFALEVSAGGNVSNTYVLDVTVD